MSIPTIVEVCMSMAFLYLVLSLMCTTMNEIIATMFRFRARDLAGAIDIFIDNKDVLKKFYANGMIKSSVGSANAGGKKAEWKTKDKPNKAGGTSSRLQTIIEWFRPNRHPSYLESTTVALALIDAVMTMPPAIPGSAATPVTSAPPAGGKAQSLQTGPSKLVEQNKGGDGTQTGGGGETEAGRQDKPKPGPIGAQLKDKLGDLTGDISSANFIDVMRGAVTIAGTDIVKIRDEIALSFDNVMDRLSGEYQRKMRRFSFLVGLVIAVAFDVDSISISRTMWGSTEMRTQIAAEAQKFVDQKWTTACDATKPPQEQNDCLTGELKQLSAQLAPFPLGWDTKKLNWEFVRNNKGAVVLKAIGLLWTGLALSLGGPFWFDLLQNFVNVRGSGKKPESEKKKSAKDTSGSDG
ncbi:hypothetical protein J3P71_19075 [Rhizobium leguminosarum]|uniref:hypothetical protein n=1 Tax=Rhizobium leguminosarum TaxID=384 RepID=UPI0014411E59|nr:hypothetical protein [Rhizobium leguminosarum]MBY5840387.1 hypothetical protein [Rhizobium leguminosarum]NKM80135.1 hypothetical protein [Rhizobium leguminosarum bv. viciae]QSZ06962.1 hypothetical protein J3P71_19075 [Rhizobium leguminosarum]